MNLLVGSLVFEFDMKFLHELLPKIDYSFNDALFDCLFEWLFDIGKAEVEFLVIGRDGIECVEVEEDAEE